MNRAKVSSALALLLATSALSCCSGSAVPLTHQPAPNAQRSSAFRSMHGAPTIPSLVSAERDGVHLFDSNYKEYGKIVTPRGWVAMDKQGEIYLAEGNGSNLKIFAPPYTGKPTIISLSSLGYMAGVAVDWKTGIFAALTNHFGCCGPGNVSFFQHGATTPCNVVNASYITGRPNFDAESTLFYTIATGTTGVASMAGECSAITEVRYGNFQQISDIQFNANDDLIVDADVMFTFEHPVNGKLGRVLYKTKLNKISGLRAVMVSLSSDGKYVLAEPANNFRPGIGLYKYPEGGAAVRIISGISGIYSAAVYPQLVP